MSKNVDLVEVRVKSTTSRVAEMVLGIIGGIFGMIAGVMALFVGEIGAALDAEGGTGVAGLGLACIAVSVLALVLSCMINKKRILFGWLIIICGILNIIFVSVLGILSGIIIVVAGILSLSRK